MPASYEELMWVVDDYLKSYEMSLREVAINFDCEALGIVISKFKELRLMVKYLNKFPFQHDTRLINLKESIKKLDTQFIKMISRDSEGYLNALEHDLIRLLNKYETLMNYLLKNEPETHLQLLEIRDRIQFELDEIKSKRDISNLEARLVTLDNTLKANSQEVIKKFGEATLPFPVPEKFWWRKMGGV